MGMSSRTGEEERKKVVGWWDTVGRTWEIREVKGRLPRLRARARALAIWHYIVLQSSLRVRENENSFQNASDSVTPRVGLGPESPDGRREEGMESRLIRTYVAGDW